MNKSIRIVKSQIILSQLQILSIKNLSQFKQVSFFSPLFQIILILVLFFIRFIQAYFSQDTLVRNLPRFVIIFAPIYEEVVFRGFLLSFFSRRLNIFSTIVATSLLFGLWHLKNYRYLGPIALSGQIIYAGLVIGPILSCLTVKTKTIWPGVIIHYLNNILSSFLRTI